RRGTPRLPRVAGYTLGVPRYRGRSTVPFRAPWPLGIALLIAAQGCSTPRIRIEHTAPPCIALESGATVGLETVIDPAARPAAVAEPVRGELARHLQRGPYPFVDVPSAKVIVRACPTQWTYEGP